jgi:flagellar biosynthesis/type III secretory pathway protein FliH
MENEVLGREYKRGRDEGKAEGEAKGKAEGELEGERRIFRRLVEKRFGSLPASIDDAIADCDINRLEALTLRVLDAANIDELFQ